ncbi:uncharacterized protein LOC120672227 [Panicum virgatum]|uniref:Avr9/Cf-9 rapidly elicited protein 146 n=1 Tax=Panicum virgatum TaxID=38727 RepID=A0A8T0SCB1_PANVG|nr:uncharacterized protein LOC120672227 [Panicum virgatum]KAG2594039.1 hypothetical protein PVAP13_5NG615200 [Panicum virgatum]
MEVPAAPAVGKRMWSYLRAIFFMARKGLLSNKRKLLLGMHLLIKRRNKAVPRTVAALLSHHHGSNALRRRDYEFSCSNSPDPAAAGFSASSRRHLAYFPCLGAVAQEDDGRYVHGSSLQPAPVGRIEYYAAAAASPAPSSPGILLRELAPGEPAAEDQSSYCCASPALQLGGGDGAFSVRVSNYSSEDEGGAGAQAVDDEVEEFIRRFYDQLRRQNTVALLPYMQESAA